MSNGKTILVSKSCYLELESKAKKSGKSVDQIATEMILRAFDLCKAKDNSTG